jgi:ABC-type glycerol-3-phosphate transport system substrate-binding protein
MRDGAKFIIVTDSKNVEATNDLIRHFLTSPVQERVWSISTAYALPAYASGWESPVITNDPNSVRGKAIALNETDFNGLHWPGPENEAIGSIAQQVYFTDMMSEIIQGRPVEDVVADYHDQFVQIYQDFGLAGE